MTLRVHTTPIEGLVVVDLVVHGDTRGWFKENWQREKMVGLGLPDFRPVQQNVSFNDEAGVTRGIHAEPWNKLVSIAAGRIFGAWVDLREGPGFGRTFTIEMGPETAVFVPRGVGNSYQTLEAGTAYAYLVDDHWSPHAPYTFLNLADDTVRIDWPVPLERSIRSDKDLAHPALADVTPFQPKPVLVLGAAGQLGSALRAEFPEGNFLTRSDCDITSEQALDGVRWADHAAVINAAAYTAVDAAESADGRAAAWAVNATAVAAIARRCADARVPLLTVSSDYVFDGRLEIHREDEAFTPLGVYGQTKAGGDLAAASIPEHWIVRATWVVGEGRNFVRTMADLAARGIDPVVVEDQFGRLTFASELARGIRHLVSTRAAFGTYNMSNSGDVVSWAEIARAVFAAVGVDPTRVSETTAAAYGAGRDLAPRPMHSALDLTKIRATGFEPRDWREELVDYLHR